jgi:hypothetical protein
MRDDLNRFIDRAQTIWQQYLEFGPGQLDAATYPPLAEAGDALLTQIESVGEASVAIRKIMQLAQVCACSANGLCFISGEAGLIPRLDQPARFEQALELLKIATNEE